jgi:hypothetical protein
VNKKTHIAKPNSRPFAKLETSPPGDASRCWRRQRLLDFWTWARESGNPKVAPDFPADFVTKHREIKAQMRRNRRHEERLLDHFYWGPPARTPIQKSQKEVSRDAKAERLTPPLTTPAEVRWPVRSQEESNHQHPATEHPTRQIVAPNVNRNPKAENNLRTLSPKTRHATIRQLVSKKSTPPETATKIGWPTRATSANMADSQKQGILEHNREALIGATSPWLGSRRSLYRSGHHGHVGHLGHLAKERVIRPLLRNRSQNGVISRIA